MQLCLDEHFYLVVSSFYENISSINLWLKSFISAFPDRKYWQIKRIISYNERPFSNSSC